MYENLSGSLSVCFIVQYFVLNSHSIRKSGSLAQEGNTYEP